MLKKVLSLMLTIGMLFSAIGSFASDAAVFGHVREDYEPEGTAISTVDEFVSMEPEKDYYLSSDIDFSGNTYAKNIYTKAFKGTLDGNGHALLGIEINGRNGDAGIFANGFAGTLKNLTIGSEKVPALVKSTGENYSVGAIAGTFGSGSHTRFENLCIYAEVRGDGKSAGFTSYINTGSIEIERCEVYGNVSGNPAAGFITLSNDSGAVDIDIKNSANYASISGKNLSAGGFFALSANVSGSRVCRLNITGCANFGAVSATDWRVGGIVGEFCEAKNSTLLIDHCFNLGAVTMSGGGGYAAGIAGGMAFDPPSGARTVRNSYNAGTVRNTVTGTAFEIAYSNSSSDKVTAEDNAYISGECDAAAKVESRNNRGAADISELLEILGAFPETADGVKFIADTSGTNGGYPMLSWQVSEHLNVKEYECGRKVCLDCGALLSAPSDENHSFKEETVGAEEYSDGYILEVCRYCSETAVKEGEACAHRIEPTDGVYVIATAGNLLWYMNSLKNRLLSGGERLMLDADIDLAGLPFCSIGSDASPFCGSFDGNYHKISGMDAEQGLFAALGNGAEVCRLAMIGAKVGTESARPAGTVAGRIGKGAVVSISDVSVTDSAVVCASDAGAVVGSSDGAAELIVNKCAVDKVEISGALAGGVVGNGNGSTLKNCYVNAQVKSSSGNSGTLACHTRTFTAKYCGYNSSMSASKKEGDPLSADKFASGEVAYRINSAGHTNCFGVSDGSTVLSLDRMKLLRVGALNVYTDKTLAPGDGVAAYTIGSTLVLVQKKNGQVRLVDSEIEVGGSPVAFSGLKLSGYVEKDGSYYTASNGAVMYIVTLDKAPESVRINGKALALTAV